MKSHKVTHNYISNPFKLIFKGFSSLFEKNQTAAIIILIVSLLGLGSNFAGGGSPPSTTQQTTGNSIGQSELTSILIAIFVVSLVVIPIIVFLATLFQGFCAYVALETGKGKTVNVGDALKVVLKKFWTLLGINIVVFFKVLGGTLLLIVPGIRAALRYKMVHMHVFDDNSSAMQAIDKSKHLTKDHLIEVFGMSFAAGIIPFINRVMDVGGQSVMYFQLKNLKASGAAKPAVHWLNYLGFIVLLFLVLLVSSLIALFLALVYK